MKKLAVAPALIFAMITAAAAQAPSPVPALPDAPRLTTYSISASNCNCPVNFAIYADNGSQDIDNWIQVFIGTSPVLSIDPTFGWSLSSPSGSLSNIARPITDAVLKFNGTQTGNITIVGAFRPRRLSQFSENRGVPARDLNQAVTTDIATLRESWDKLQGALVGQPGESILRMPPAATRANQVLAFDGSGNPTVVAVPSSIPSGQVTGPGSSTVGHLATWGNTLGTALVDTASTSVPLGGTGQSTLTAHSVLLGEGTSSLGFATIGTGGRVLVDQGAGADPAFKAVTGDASMTSAGVLTVAAGAITNSKITGPISVANGGTNGTSASGTLLDNITGFASTGFLKRTGAGAYSFIPDPLPVANGGTGDTGGAWPTYSAVVTPNTGTITTQSSDSTFEQFGKWVKAEIHVTVSAIGTGAVPITINAPVAAKHNTVCLGRETGVSGHVISGTISAATSTMAVFQYDNTSPTFSNGVVYSFSCSYEAN